MEAVKPLLSNKSVSSEKIILAENQKIPLTNNKIAETFIFSQILFTPQTSLNLVKVAQFQSFNHMIDVSISQTGAKSANIALVFKKG